MRAIIGFRIHQTFEGIFKKKLTWWRRLIIIIIIIIIYYYYYYYYYYRYRYYYYCYRYYRDSLLRFFYRLLLRPRFSRRCLPGFIPILRVLGSLQVSSHSRRDLRKIVYEGYTSYLSLLLLFFFSFFSRDIFFRQASLLDRDSSRLVNDSLLAFGILFFFFVFCLFF